MRAGRILCGGTITRNVNVAEAGCGSSPQISKPERVCSILPSPWLAWSPPIRSAGGQGAGLQQTWTCRSLPLQDIRKAPRVLEVYDFQFIFLIELELACWQQGAAALPFGVVDVE